MHKQNTREKKQKQETPLLSGFKPVLDLLKREPSIIDTIFVRKGSRNDTGQILDLCREHNIRFSLLDAKVLDKMFMHDDLPNHQGVIARLYEHGFVEFDKLLQTAKDAPLPLILALDQVQDAGNAGALARTLYALGGAGMVIPRHNGVYLGSGARRVAAGALEELAISKVTNLATALKEADEQGYIIYGAQAEKLSDNNHISSFTGELAAPAILVLGSEEKGLRPQIQKMCHYTISIPMLRDFDSLNVAQAGGILISNFLRYQMYNKD